MDDIIGKLDSERVHEQKAMDSEGKADLRETLDERIFMPDSAAFFFCSFLCSGGTPLVRAVSLVRE